MKRTSVRVYDNQIVDGSPSVDVYVPPENHQLNDNDYYPVIFYIHGGAWHLGSKENSKNPCETLAKNGYVCVATSYSLSSVTNAQLESVLIVFILTMLALVVTSTSVSEMMLIFIFMFIVTLIFLSTWVCVPRSQVQHPQHILDVAKTFQWTVENIAEYGGDKNKIYVMGHSAGGHLSSLLCTNFQFLQTYNVDPKYVKACIAISGVYSDKRLQQSQMGKQILSNAFGKRQVYYDAFPIYNVNINTPPFLLLNAGMDLSLKRHSMDLHYVLMQSGVYVRTEYFEDKSHWNITRGWENENEKVLETIESFLKEVEQFYI